MNIIDVSQDNEEKEYTVTIPLEKYTDLVLAKRELDNLIDFIFNTVEYSIITEKLLIDKDKLELYLRNVWRYDYMKTVNKLKEK